MDRTKEYEGEGVLLTCPLGGQGLVREGSIYENGYIWLCKERGFTCPHGEHELVPSHYLPAATPSLHRDPRGHDREHR